jgi:hypothetical protein
MPYKMTHQTEQVTIKTFDGTETVDAVVVGKWAVHPADDEPDYYAVTLIATGRPIPYVLLGQDDAVRFANNVNSIDPKFFHAYMQYFDAYERGEVVDPEGDALLFCKKIGSILSWFEFLDELGIDEG